jgi:sulfhydrogenase subunit alpha
MKKPGERGKTAGTRTIEVANLARVEGEGRLYVKIKDGRVSDVELNIFEPPRFFEALLRGRAFTEPPDITARICGICPVAYQMSACRAIEDACGVSVEGPIQDLRRLLYCGEWIQSHALHVHMLHAPDFLGYESAIHMARDHAVAVERGLGIKKAGNALMALLGGREVHPINVKIGGFYKVPTVLELKTVEDQLLRARDAALETVKWVSRFAFPDFEHDYEFVALHDPAEYAIDRGRVASSSGLDIEPRLFEEYFEEEHVQHSTALQARMRDRGPYLTGPMARYSLNFDRLSPLARSAAADAGLGPVCRNPFQSIVVRSVEIVYACDEALRIISGYEKPESPFVHVEPRRAIGYGCTEAPRGLLYHRYAIDEQGMVIDARIVPPTSQNQKTIEDDIRRFVERYLDLSQERLQWQCEQVIRNYDPCISCATHFLRLHIETE